MNPLHTLRASLSAGVLVCSAAWLAISGAQAKPLALEVSTGTPVVPANETRNAFIKVSLVGDRMPERRHVRAPINVAIVLDRSGSMQGDKLREAKRAAQLALNYLQADDIISVVSYDNTVRVDVPATRATDRNALHNAIEQIRAGGNTALFAGVAKGAKELRKFIEQQAVNRVILLSDGLANVGPSSPRELGSLGNSLAREGISVTTIGLGLHYNEDLMVELAQRADGNHVFAERASDLASVFAAEFNDITSVVASDIDIIIECADGVRPLRVLGRDADIRGNQVRSRLGQVYSEQEKYVLLEVEVPADRAGQKRKLANVQVAYQDVAAARQLSASDDLWVSYSASEREVVKNYDKDTLGEALRQEANLLSKEAVELRDAGDVEGAKATLESASGYLRKKGADYALPASVYEPAAADYEQQAEEVDDAKEWQRSRKAMKAEQYRIDNQQRAPEK